ncbi:MAG: hypothetical protein KJ737_16250 [Proteobacteria bacterium]|nr:hypothetical protein [Pseudomonadota bacterium]
MKRTIRKKAFVTGFFFIVCLSVGLFASCGKKTLPVPPTPFDPPSVEQLSYAIDGNIVTLSWLFTEKAGKKEIPVSGFFVYRAKLKLAEGLCEGCPVKFRRIAEIRYGSESKYAFRESISAGNRYIYKVTPFSDNGMKGNLPATVQFEF